MLFGATTDEITYTYHAAMTKQSIKSQSLARVGLQSFHNSSSYLTTKCCSADCWHQLL